MPLHISTKRKKASRQCIRISPRNQAAPKQFSERPEPLEAQRSVTAESQTPDREGPGAVCQPQ